MTSWPNDRFARTDTEGQQQKSEQRRQPHPQNRYLDLQSHMSQQRSTASLQQQQRQHMQQHTSPDETSHQREDMVERRGIPSVTTCRKVEEERSCQVQNSMGFQHVTIASASSSRDHIQSLTGHLQAETDKLRMWKTHTETEISIKDQKLAELQRTLNSARKSVMDLRMENETVNMKLKHEVDNRGSLYLRIDAVKELCNELKNYANSVSTHMSKYEGEQVNLVSAAQLHERQFDKLSTRFVDLSLSTEHLTQDISTKFEHDRQTLLERQEEFDRKFSEVQNECDKLRDEMMGKDASIDSLTSQCTQTMSTVDQLKSTLTLRDEHIDSMTTQLNNRAEELRALYAAEEYKSSQLITLQRSLDEGQQAKIDLKTEIDHTKERLLFVEKERDEQLSNMIGLRAELDQTKECLLLVEKERDDQLSNMIGLRAELDQTKERLLLVEKERDDQLSNMIGLRAELDQAKERLRLVEKDRDEQFSNMIGLSAELDHTKERLLLVEKDRDEHLSNMIGLRAEIDQTKERLLLVEKQRDEQLINMIDLRAELDQTKERLLLAEKDKEEQIAVMSAHAETKENELNGVKVQLCQNSTEFTSLQQQYENLMSRLEMQIIQNKEVSERCAEIEEKGKQEIRSLTTQFEQRVDEKNCVVKEVQNELSKSQMKLCELRVEFDLRGERCCSLEENVKSLEVRLSDTESRLRETEEKRISADNQLQYGRTIATENDQQLEMLSTKYNQLLNDTNKEIQQLHHECEKLKCENVMLQSVRVEVEEGKRNVVVVRDQLNAELKRRDQLVGQVKSLEEDKLSLQTELSTVKLNTERAYKRLEGELASSRADTLRANNDMQELMIRLKALEEQELSTSKTLNNLLEQERTDRHKNEEAHKTKQAQLQKELTALKTVNTKLKTSMEKVEADRRQAIGQIANSTEQCKQAYDRIIASKNDELVLLTTSTNTQIDKLMHDNKDLEEQLASFKQQLIDQAREAAEALAAQGSRATVEAVGASGATELVPMDVVYDERGRGSTKLLRSTLTTPAPRGSSAPPQELAHSLKRCSAPTTTLCSAVNSSASNSGVVGRKKRTPSTSILSLNDSSMSTNTTPNNKDVRCDGVGLTSRQLVGATPGSVNAGPPSNIQYSLTTTIPSLYPSQTPRHVRMTTPMSQTAALNSKNNEKNTRAPTTVVMTPVLGSQLFTPQRSILRKSSVVAASKRSVTFASSPTDSNATDESSLCDVIELPLNQTTPSVLSRFGVAVPSSYKQQSTAAASAAMEVGGVVRGDVVGGGVVGGGVVGGGVVSMLKRDGKIFFKNSSSPPVHSNKRGKKDNITTTTGPTNKQQQQQKSEQDNVDWFDNDDIFGFGPED